MIEQFFHQKDLRDRLRFILFPLSRIYQTVVFLRHFLYSKGVFRAKKVDVPIVCVGSVFVGGSGKTPFVRLLLEHLPANTFVLSRGYKTIDEPLFFLNSVVKKNRYEGAKECISKGANLILLDDGLQHLQLQKEISLAVLSVNQLFEGFHFLPFGYLRDTPQTLRKVQYIVLHEVVNLEEYMRAKSYLKSFSDALFIGTCCIPSGLFDLKNATVEGIKKVVLISGISRPSRFYAMMQNLGYEILEHYIFSDHEKIDLDFLEEKIKWAKSLNAAVVVTEKDAVKYPDTLDLLQFKVKTSVMYENENFDHLIRSIYETLG
jgi:tetraacyldisaccharide 4'-kinase